MHRGLPQQQTSSPCSGYVCAAVNSWRGVRRPCGTTPTSAARLSWIFSCMARSRATSSSLALAARSRSSASSCGAKKGQERSGGEPTWRAESVVARRRTCPAW